MNAAALLRDRLARGAVVRQLAAAHDRIAVREQVLRGEGRVVEAADPAPKRRA